LIAKGSTSGSESDLARLARHDLNLLVPLFALLDEVNVTRAAQRVGLSQPAMSHILQRCRDLLADELLVRVGGRMQLTPYGRAFRDPLMRALKMVRQVIEPQDNFDPSECERAISIAVSTATATAIVPGLIQRLKISAPKISVRLVRSLLPSDDLMDRPEIDLAVLPDTVLTHHSRIRLYQDPWMVVVAADSIAAEGTFDVDQLQRRQHVAYWSDGMIKPYERMEAEGLKWTTCLTVHDFVVLPLLLLGTDMVSILPGRLARRLQVLGQWKAFPLPVDVAPLKMDLVWNPRLKEDPLSLWLTDVLKQECGQLG